MKTFQSALIVFGLVSFVLANGEEVIHPNEENEGSRPSSLWGALNDRIPQVAASPHIMGGKQVVPHSHPYHVSVKYSYIGDYEGGGVLIAPRWVLTSANIGILADWVMLGAHDYKEQSADNRNKQKISVQLRHKHPNYNPETHADDITLLFLKTPAKLDKFVQLIRLPALSQRNQDYTGTEVTLVGWGYGNWGITDYLQSVQTTVVDNTTCANQLFNPNQWASHICTDGKGGKGGCKVDGGGPVVVIEKDGKPTVIGVIQYVYRGSCNSSLPTVTTRVDNYLEFISKETGIPMRK